MQRNNGNRHSILFLGQLGACPLGTLSLEISLQAREKLREKEAVIQDVKSAKEYLE